MTQKLLIAQPQTGPRVPGPPRSYATGSASQRGVELVQRLGRGQRERLAGSDQMSVLAFRREAVPHPEMGVDVVPRRRPGAQLLAQLADEHVDRPIAVSHRVT